MEGPARLTELKHMDTVLEAVSTHLVPEVACNEGVGMGNATRHAVGLEETICLKTDNKNET